MREPRKAEWSLALGSNDGDALRTFSRIFAVLPFITLERRLERFACVF
jgi:hypothetical protein